MTLKGGDFTIQLAEAVSHGELDINLDESLLWSQTREAWIFWL